MGYEGGGFMLTTPLCHTFGMTAPIFSVGMGALAGPTLAAAVSNAGACGILGRVSGAPAAHLRKQIREVRALTDKPFGVNIILATLQAEWIEICLDELVPLLVFFWGDPQPYVQDAHRRGIKHRNGAQRRQVNRARVLCGDLLSFARLQRRHRLHSALCG